MAETALSGRQGGYLNGDAVKAVSVETKAAFSLSLLASQPADY
jgi:hypothetical protein